MELRLIQLNLIGSDINGFIGDLSKIGLTGVGQNVLEGTQITEMAFIAFQCMFAALTPALIIGAFAERMKFKGFAVIGSTILYKIVNKFITLRVDETEEITGLDLVEHGERGYNLGIFSGSISFIGNKEFESSPALNFCPCGV